MNKESGRVKVRFDPLRIGRQVELKSARGLCFGFLKKKKMSV